ncbi:MAG: adenylate/guanylate cyclase domain-containing protein [Rhodoplanes sp.]
MEAARDAFNGIATVNMRRNRAGAPEIRFGVGLHVGEVVYGNVGTPDRSDFTVMGAAVNRAARLQSLTKEVARPVLTSADFAACIDDPVESLGRHLMKGVKEPQEIFAPGSL